MKIELSEEELADVAIGLQLLHKHCSLKDNREEVRRTLANLTEKVGTNSVIRAVFDDMLRRVDNGEYLA